MSERRNEPFVLALAELRGRLQSGEIALDRRLAATEIAGDLGLSATPVREALSRLAGEGLLEDRRGEGFFVRRLGRADLAVLYRLSLAHLTLAAEMRGSEALSAEPDARSGPVDDPVGATERLFAHWAAASGSRALAGSYARMQSQLGAARRLEPRLFEDLGEELVGLTDPEAEVRRRLVRLRAFFGRRIRLAGRLAEMLEEGSGRLAL